MVPGRQCKFHAPLVALKFLVVVVSCPAGPVLIVQTPSGDISPFSWARKCEPARILAGQSESKSYIIERKRSLGKSRQIKLVLL